MGETSDISVFRFGWFSPIWYYNGRTSMPRSKMRKGFVLGIADSVGDPFTYLIAPEEFILKPRKRRHPHLTRSVIRLRNLADDDQPPMVEEKANSLKFYNCEGEELVGDDELITIDGKDMADDNDVADGLSPSSVGAKDIATDDTTVSTSTINTSQSLESCDILYSDIPLTELLCELNSPPDDIPSEINTITPLDKPVGDSNGTSMLVVS